MRLETKQLIGSAIASLALSAGLLVGMPCRASAVPSQADLDAAREQLDTIGGELAALQDNLAEQEEALSLTQDQLVEIGEKIEQTQADLADAQEVLSSRMRSSYKVGPVQFLEVILGSTSVDDFLNRIYYLDKITQSEADAIEVVNDLQDQLSEQKGELEATEARQQAQLDETQENVEVYTERLADAQAYFNQLDAEVQAELRRQAEAEAAAAAAAAAEGAEVEEQTGTSTVVAAIEETESAAAVADDVSAATTTTDDDYDDDEDDDDYTDSGSSSSSSSSSSSVSYSAVNYGDVISNAYQFVGWPYVTGSISPTNGGFCCSGLTYYCYHLCGYEIPTNCGGQIARIQSLGHWKTSMSELNPGDLIFTHSGHVGIYLGGGMMIDAPTEGRTIQARSLWGQFYGGGCPV